MSLYPRILTALRSAKTLLRAYPGTSWEEAYELVEGVLRDAIPAYVDISQFDMTKIVDGKTSILHLEYLELDFVPNPTGIEPGIGCVRYAVDVNGAMHFFKSNFDSSD